MITIIWEYFLYNFMIVSEDEISDFCCTKLEEHSRKPQKCISFNLYWRKYELAPIEPKALIFCLEKSGMAVDQGFINNNRSGPIGNEPITIEFCPWCGTKIEFK